MLPFKIRRKIDLNNIITSNPLSSLVLTNGGGYNPCYNCVIDLLNEKWKIENGKFLRKILEEHFQLYCHSQSEALGIQKSIPLTRISKLKIFAKKFFPLPQGARGRDFGGVICYQ